MWNPVENAVQLNIASSEQQLPSLGNAATSMIIQTLRIGRLAPTGLSLLASRSGFGLKSAVPPMAMSISSSTLFIANKFRTGRYEYDTKEGLVLFILFPPVKL